MSLLARLQDYLAQGGLVMLPLIGVTFALWYALGYRVLRLRRGKRQTVAARIARLRERPQPRGAQDRAVVQALELARQGRRGLGLRLEAWLAAARDDLGRGATLARTIVVIAPLLGLLGTVNGMIELFDSLGSGTVYSQGGGIAQGIAEALFTTQLGLAVAIPGFFVSRMLERREEHLVTELEQAKGLLGGAA
ncbi:MAG: MotA/TolQ/ExbB proton channel family protein [Planctomycetota bacterium]